MIDDEGDDAMIYDALEPTQINLSSRAPPCSTPSEEDGGSDP